MEIDPTAIRQRIDDLEAANYFARAAELRRLIGLPTRTEEAARVVERFNLVNERSRLVQVGWRYPYGGGVHPMDWEADHPEHVVHESCVPVYVLKQ